LSCGLLQIEVDAIGGVVEPHRTHVAAIHRVQEL